MVNTYIPIGNGDSDMKTRVSAPIAIVDEHPDWSTRLIAELQHRRLPFEKIDHASHGYDPHDRRRRYSVVVNRTSPSSHRRGHGSVLFYAEALLHHYESLGIPVINPVAAYRFEKSKALQVELFERLGLGYPRTLVVNDRAELVKASAGVRFPVLVKPNVGGSGALIERFDSRVDLYDVNATSNFVANAPAVLGFDPTARFADYIVGVATGRHASRRGLTTS